MKHMKIFYLHQKALLSFLVFLFSIGVYSGRAQSISLSLDTQYPPAQNIGPGSDNNIIGAYSIFLFSGSTTLTSVKFTTKGTYNVSDLKANSFKLWRGYAGFPQGNALLSQTAIVASGNSIVFSGLSEVFSSWDEIYITADVASSATPGNTLFLGSTPQGNFTFSSGTTGGPPLSSTNVQTIGTPLPVVSIYNNTVNSQNISPGSLGNDLYGFFINSSDADAELTSITFPTQGTYITSDIAANGFKLWYHDYFSYPQRDVLVDSAASIASGGNLVFSGLSVNINKDHNWGMSFYVTADLSSGAVAGHTIGISATPLSNFTFTQAQSVSGSNPIPVGALSTVAVPTITVSSLPVASGTISPSSVNNIIYQANIVPSGSNAALTKVSFTTTGTYQLSDIPSGGFKLWRASDQGGQIILDTMISSTNPVASGSNVDFNLSNYTVDEDNGNNPIFVLTVDISGAAVLNRTIGIQAITSTNVTAIAGTIIGSGTAGGIQTINIPSITFTPSGPAAGIISPGTLVILHTVQIDVTGAPATFGGASFQLSGTYVPADFSPGGVSLVYHKTSNLQEDMDNGQYSYLSQFDTMPSSGQSLVFQFVSSQYTNPTIPLGTGYISVISLVSFSAVTGHTIQVASPGVSGYTLASGNKSGTTGTGGVQTIGIPAIAVSAITTAAGNTSQGINNQLLYKIKLDVTNANAALDSLILITGGSYTTSDVSYFGLYLSQDSVLNTDSDKQMGYVNGISSGDSLIFNTYAQINAGTSGYLFVVANIRYSAVAGRTINITATPSTAFVFASGTVTGSFPLPAGGLQTIAAPGSITLSFPAVAASNITTGSDNNIIYKFNVTASAGGPILLNFVDLTTSGNFVASDIKPSGFKLWYSTSGSFAGSTSLGIASAVNNGGHLQFYLLSNTTIDPGTTGYFFVTANISSSAVVGHTINIAATVAANFSFASGTATGSGAAGGVQTFAAPGSITLSFPTVAASDITPGSDDNIIYRFNATVSGAATSLSYLSLLTSGNFVVSDIKTHGFKLWYNTSNVFAGSVMIKDVAAIDNGGILYFSSINTSIASGTTGYFFVTASTSSTAIVGHTIQIAATDSTDFSFGADAVTGSGGAGGVQTINITVTALFNKKPTGRAELYPNPSKEREVVILNTGNVHSKIINIYNSTGERIKSYEADGDIVYIDSPESGMYMIIIQDQYDNQTETRKLVVE
jgi:hypothetical protein